jgi:hypothetical protein
MAADGIFPSKDGILGCRYFCVGERRERGERQGFKLANATGIFLEGLTPATHYVHRAPFEVGHAKVNIATATPDEKQSIIKCDFFL